jgi:hypothetical protein
VGLLGLRILQKRMLKPDIEGLEITRGELRNLIGMSVQTITASFRSRVLLWSLWYILVAASGLSLLRLVLHLLAISIALPLSLIGLLSVGLGILLAIWHRWSWLKANVSPVLRSLLDDVQRFNLVVRAIAINDQIEAAGNPAAGLSDREKVVEALWLTRQDLIRALKTERVLRENRDFISQNPALFENNLATLTTLQLSDRATEHSRLLNEALQIALSTREEMQKLQNGTS